MGKSLIQWFWRAPRRAGQATPSLTEPLVAECNTWCISVSTFGTCYIHGEGCESPTGFARPLGAGGFASMIRETTGAWHGTVGSCSAIPPQADLPIWFYTSRRFPPIRIPPETPPDDSPDDSQLYEVRIIDNDYNTYQEVMDITMLALGISRELAFAVAWEVDHRGYCVVAHASYEVAEGLADVIRSIGIEVQVNPLAGHAE